MGRTVPSRGAPPLSSRKDARAKRAKQTLNKDIPALLQAYPRARKGIESTKLIVNPRPVGNSNHDESNIVEDAATNNPEQGRPGYNVSAMLDSSKSSTTREPVKVTIRIVDTFQAANDLQNASRSRNPKASRVAVLNMASPLRPGGGFLNGATSQEESLCMRSTLYTALRDDFYRLPEFGGVWTPDILVFRAHHEDAPDLPKNERFFVDVITSAMIRHPDVELDDDGLKRFVNEQDREITEKKMRAVMRIAKGEGVRKLVLGAWGCGAYGGPVPDVAAIWRKVLLGGGQTEAKPRHKASVSKADMWEGMEIVFAIKEKTMAESFAHHFGTNVEAEGIAEESENGNEGAGEDAEGHTEVEDKIAELEAQIAAARSEVLKSRLRSIVEKLRSEGEQ